MKYFQPAVYIITNQSGVLYTGVTSNLPQRIWQHKEGNIAGFTQKYKVKYLLYYEFLGTMADAFLREKRIKKWRREFKIRLIKEMNPRWRDLSEDITG